MQETFSRMLPMPFLPLAVLVARLVAPAPFAVGETLQYDARLGFFPVGTAALTVSGTEPVRGVPSYRFTMNAQGGPPGFRVRYDLTSWAGTAPLISRRFHSHAEERGTTHDHRFEIIADSGRYREEGVPEEWATPPGALDEIALLYYLRTIPLAVGQRQDVSRYFRTGYNPLHLEVTGRESVPLGDGSSVPCLTVRVSAAGAYADLWLSDDARRLPVQLSLPMPFGRVTLLLQSAPPAR